MYIKILTLFVISGCLYRIQAQLCIPDPVDYVELSNTTLSWAPSQNCPNTQYELHIVSDSALEYEYDLNETSLDISFLFFCEDHSFTVIPVADHIMGLEYTFTGSMELPSDTDIPIRFLRGFPIDNDLLIQWEIERLYRMCVSYFDLTVWDDEIKERETFQVTQSGHLFEQVPRCTHYYFEITANYLNRQGTTGQFDFMIVADVNTPTLVSVEQSAVTINTTWSLESYSINRCKVTELYVNSTRFNQTVLIEDSPARPDVEVSITGLTANSMYYFNVSINNSGGISRPVQIAVQTLPIEYTSD